MSGSDCPSVLRRLLNALRRPPVPHAMLSPRRKTAASVPQAAHSTINATRLHVAMTP